MQQGFKKSSYNKNVGYNYDFYTLKVDVYGKTIRLLSIRCLKTIKVQWEDPT